MIFSLWLVLHHNIFETLHRNFVRACRGYSPAEEWRGERAPVSALGKEALLFAFISSATIFAAFSGAATSRLMSPKFDVRILIPQTPSLEYQLKIHSSCLQKYRDFTEVLSLNGSADAQWPIRLTSRHLGGPQCDGLTDLYKSECVSRWPHWP